ncbi:MAG: hypothetical protein M3R17_17460 [Bacteroidota bacterium]|nr:hypothetical protein [Bacteroidota bacterium]
MNVLSGDGDLKLSEIYYPQYLISDVYRDIEGNLLLSTFNHGILIIPNPGIPDVLPVADNRAVVSIHTDNVLGMLMGTLNGELIGYKNGNYLKAKHGLMARLSKYRKADFELVIVA